MSAPQNEVLTSRRTCLRAEARTKVAYGKFLLPIANYGVTLACGWPDVGLRFAAFEFGVCAVCVRLACGLLAKFGALVTRACHESTVSCGSHSFIDSSCGSLAVRFSCRAVLLRFCGCVPLRARRFCLRSARAAIFVLSIRLVSLRLACGSAIRPRCGSLTLRCGRGARRCVSK